MKVKGVCGPRSEAYDEIEPALAGELAEERYRILEGQRTLPFRTGLAILVLPQVSETCVLVWAALAAYGDLNTLLPSEEVAEALLSDWQDTLGKRLCLAAGGLHGVLILLSCSQKTGKQK